MSNLTELNKLPFDVSDVLGEVIDFQKECPGVYYVATVNKDKLSSVATEYYVVTDEATMISPVARAYGKQIGTSPVLLVYDLNDASSGKFIVDYEILRYKISNHLPLPEDRMIHEIAVFGRELHPDYFGAFPVPQLTPWGYTLRYKAITNGLYWIETDTCQTVLAVCFPMQDELSSAAVDLSRLTDYDAVHGLDSTMGYMFFSERDSCIPLFELLEPRSQWQNCIDKAALMNAICEYHMDYALTHNLREAHGLNDHFSKMMGSMCEDYKPQSSQDNIISASEQVGTKFFGF